MKVSVDGIPQGGPPDAGRGEEVDPQQVEGCCEDGVYRGAVVQRRYWNRRKFYNSLGTKARNEILAAHFADEISFPYRGAVVQRRYWNRRKICTI